MEDPSVSSERRKPLLGGRGRAVARDTSVRTEGGSEVGAAMTAGDNSGAGGADTDTSGSWSLSWGAKTGVPSVLSRNEGDTHLDNACSTSSSSRRGLAAGRSIAGTDHQARTLRAVSPSTCGSNPDYSAVGTAGPWFPGPLQQQCERFSSGARGLAAAAAISAKIRRAWAGEGAGHSTAANAAEVDLELQRRQLGTNAQGSGTGRTTVREVLTDDEDDEEDSSWYCYCMPQLTHVERLLGWLICFVGGLVISGLSVGSFYDLFRGRSMRFAVAYTLGNCVGLLGTTFLVGPARQLQGMADPSRLTTSCIFAGSLALTLFFSLFLPVPLLVISCVCVQWLAYIWYSLSYIPYGQDSILWCMRAVAAHFR